MLRRASVKDLDSIQRLNKQLGYETEPEYLIQKINDSNIILYLYEESYKVIGFVAGTVFDYFYYPKRIARLDGLVVDKEFRRKSVGKILLSCFEEEAKKRECTMVELSSGLPREKEGTYDFYIRENYLNQTDYGVTYFRKDI